MLTNITPKKHFSKIGRNYLILGISTLIFQIILVNIITLILPGIIRDMNMLLIISSLCNYILPFPIFYYLMKKLDSGHMEKTDLSIRKFLVYTCITIMLISIGNLVGLGITGLIGGITQTDITNPVEVTINNGSIWSNLIIISIISPIFEEIFFRKILVDRVIQFGVKPAILVSGVLFALFHGNLNQFVYTFLVGSFFAYVYVKTGKIIYPILLHIIINIFGSVFSMIVSQSAAHLSSGANIGDVLIILIYFLILASSFIVGMIAILNHKKEDINNPPAEVELENPLKTIFINGGMISFVVFYLIIIILQLGII